MRRSASLRLLAVVAALLTSCAAFETSAAVVNGEKIDEREFRRQLDYLAADPRFAAEFAGQVAAQKKNLGRQLLTFLIHQEFIEEYAEAEGLSAREAEVEARLDELIMAQGEDAFRDQLAESGATLADARAFVRKQLLRETVAQAVVEEEVPEATLRQEYESRAAEFSEVHVAHILVSTEERAQDILDRATPENFAGLARRLSEDPGTANQGGDLGTRPATEFVEPFRQTTLDIPVGEIGGPVQTQFGFHIVHVIERTSQPFEEVRERLLREIGQESFTAWLLERIRGADILVNPRYGTLDERTGEVVERRSTTPEPQQVQLTP